MEREEQEAWELAKQLVQIDSSDPGAYEEEIGLWITDWFKKQITDFGGKLADQILCACGEKLLEKKLFSTVFLTGKGFERQDWPPAL